MIKDEIIKAIQKVVRIEKVNLEFPENAEFGDFSTNVAMVSSKKEGKDPHDLAEEIVKKIKDNKELAKIIEKIEVAGPGFINFWLKKEVLLGTLRDINSQKDAFGKLDLAKGKRLMFEFGQPNTHKIPHIGHLFSYIFGFAMSNLLEAIGHKLFRVNYQGDIGPHVAKCLWALKKEQPQIPESLHEKAQLLQEMYQTGSKAYDEDDKAKSEIDEINKKIYSKDAEIFKLWQETRGWSVDYYKEFEKRLGISYDRYYFESEVEDEGKKIVLDNVGKVFGKSQGAIIFPGKKYGLHDRVFITKNGTPTYEAKDMYLQVLKYKEWLFDLMIITTAHEQNEYFKVVFKALEILNPELVGKLMHIGFGMINLKTGKMSSRTGQIIGGIELVDHVVARIRKIVEDRQDLSAEKKDEIADAVGIGAVKYSFLKNNPLQDTKFDIEESISSEGNSGPYLQYTFARCQSVLAKAKTFNSKKLNAGSLNSEESTILRCLSQFPEIIATAAKNYSPNLLCNYLYDLAQKFNNFYNAQRIIGAENESFRLALTAGVGQVLKNGLSLLGIASPERM